MISIYRKNTEKDYTGCFSEEICREFTDYVCASEKWWSCFQPHSQGITHKIKPVSLFQHTKLQLLTLGIHGIGGAPCDGDWYLASLSAVNEIMGKTRGPKI